MSWFLFFDQLAFRIINQGFTDPFLDLYMPWITDVQRKPIFLVFIAIILAHFIYKFRLAAWKPFLFVAVAVGLSDVVAYRVIKPVVERPRPSHVEEMKTILRVESRGGLLSFPSNHAANTFALAMSLSLISAWWITPAFAIALVIGFSRVYVGVHYPLDIVGGAILGMLISWLLWTFLFKSFLKLKKSKTTKKKR